jgi:hypothetical protein
MDIVELCDTHVRERFNEADQHYPGCEQAHVVCAMRELLDLTRHLLTQVVESDRQLDEERAQHRAEVDRLAEELRRVSDEAT